MHFQFIIHTGEGFGDGAGGCQTRHYKSEGTMSLLPKKMVKFSFHQKNFFCVIKHYHSPTNHNTYQSWRGTLKRDFWLFWTVCTMKSRCPSWFSLDCNLDYWERSSMQFNMNNFKRLRIHLVTKVIFWLKGGEWGLFRDWTDIGLTHKSGQKVYEMFDGVYSEIGLTLD